MASDEIANVAAPPLRVPVPSVVLPSLNVTVPVGVPLAGAAAVTVAVKVTDCPKTEGFADEVTPVVLLAWFTTCGFVFSEPVLVAKFVSPAYTAVIV